MSKQKSGYLIFLNNNVSQELMCREKTHDNNSCFKSVRGNTRCNGFKLRDGKVPNSQVD